MRVSTSRKPISSPRPACPARSPSPPTWRAAVPTFTSVGPWEMSVQQETAGITDEAEKAKKIEQIKADIERFREIVLKAEETIEVEPAKGSKSAKTVRQ